MLQKLLFPLDETPLFVLALWFSEVVQDSFVRNFVHRCTGHDFRTIFDELFVDRNRILWYALVSAAWSANVLAAYGWAYKSGGIGPWQQEVEKLSTNIWIGVVLPGLVVFAVILRMVVASARLRFRALALAVGRGDTATVQSLLDAGMSVDALDKNNVGYLEVAVTRGHVDVADALLGKKADANVRAIAGASTCLHVAVVHGHVDMATVLVQHAADPTQQDGQGNCAAHLVFANECTVTLALFDLVSPPVLGMGNAAGVTVLQRFLHWSAYATDMAGDPFPAAQQLAAELRAEHADLLTGGPRRVTLTKVDTSDAVVEAVGRGVRLFEPADTEVDVVWLAILWDTESARPRHELLNFGRR